MTQEEKDIYNLFLKTQKQAKQQPYKLRKDFSEFEKGEVYPQIQRLVQFFNTYRHVNKYLFFIAPYKIFNISDTFYLDYYLTQKAIKAYSDYLKQLDEEDPDSNEHYEFVKQSLRFLKEYLISNNLKINDYAEYCPEINPIWVIHLLQRNISVFCLLAIPKFEYKYNQLSYEIKEFILGEEFVSNFDKYKVRYLNSQRTRKLAKVGLEFFIKN